MTILVKLETARQLVVAGAIQGAEVIGLPGGWAVHLRTRNKTQVLATRQAEPRLFSRFETALTTIRDLGLYGRIVVDAEKWTAEGPYTRRRPDRSAAMMLKEADARYTAMLRDTVLEARNDPRPALSSDEAAERMDSYKATLRKKLDAASGHDA